MYVRTLVAHNTGIFIMSTAMHSYSTMTTVQQRFFLSGATQIMKMNWSLSTSKPSVTKCFSNYNRGEVYTSCYTFINTYSHSSTSPSCRQTTLASLSSQPLSQTVPHVPRTQISTNPSVVVTSLPIRRTSPSLQSASGT